MKNLFRNCLRSAGFDLTGFSPKFHPAARKLHLLQAFGLEVFFDIGANQGQFGSWLRTNGWSGKIYSFEPGSQAFSALKLRAGRDLNWEAHQVALGSKAGNMELHISKDSFSSSLKPPTETNIGTCPDVETDFSEVVAVKTLDEAVEEILPGSAEFALKIDVQGHESEVLQGAGMALRRCRLLIVELSLRELYHGQKLLHELLPEIYGQGFYLTVMEPCHEDFSGMEILQMDAWFLKTSAPSRESPGRLAHPAVVG
jgi:FkbM family methyltransferase